MCLSSLFIFPELAEEQMLPGKRKSQVSLRERSELR